MSTAAANQGEEIDSTTGGKKDDGISLTVKHSDGTDLVFRVRPTTKFQKLMEAYATRKGFNLTTIKFLYDGKQLVKTHTPAMLKMSSGAQIDATSKVGGG